jgi:preprotein translocase subunit YajC
MLINLFFTLQAQGNGLVSLLPMIMIFVIMYFFFLRPQIKKQKEQAQFVDAIKKGDEVVTTSGLIGKIESIVDEEVSLNVDSKTTLRFMKSSISKELTESHKKSIVTKA